MEEGTYTNKKGKKVQLRKQKIEQLSTLSTSCNKLLDVLKMDIDELLAIQAQNNGEGQADIQRVNRRGGGGSPLVSMVFFIIILGIVSSLALLVLQSTGSLPEPYNSYVLNVANTIHDFLDDFIE